MVEGFEDSTAAVERLAAGAPLHEVIDVAAPGAWLALDAGMRYVPWRLDSLRRDPVVALPTDLSGVEESLLALALCHGDGRIREKALRQAGRFPALLPLVVIRCADWAGPVREDARRLLQEALDADTAPALAALLLELGRRDRGAFGVEALDRVLRGAPGDRLAALFGHPDRTVRRFVYRLAVEERLLGPAAWALAAAQDTDNVIRDLCATAALTAVSKGECPAEDVLTSLLSARDPRTRSAGVTALRAAGLPERATAFLDDRSALVRACARYVVREHGGDPTAHYRARCAAPEDPALPGGAVSGLAECGDRADTPLLVPLLTHPLAGVRARAVAALRTLASVDTQQIRPLLDDPDPGVVREATDTLLPRAGHLPAEWLEERTGSGHPRHVRVSALRLLGARGGVVALRATTVLADDPDETLRRRAREALYQWRPSPAEPKGDAEIGCLLDRCGHLLRDHDLRLRKWEAGVLHPAQDPAEADEDPEADEDGSSRGPSGHALTRSVPPPVDWSGHPSSSQVRGAVGSSNPRSTEQQQVRPRGIPAMNTHETGTFRPRPSLPVPVLRDPRALSHWVTGLLVLSAALVVFSLYVWITAYNFYAEQYASYDPWPEQRAAELDRLITLSDTLRMNLLLPTAAVFLVWFRRVRENAQVFAPEGFRRGPGWSLGSWFVPVVNFWMPYRIAVETWTASTQLPAAGQPARPSLGTVNSWWGLWITATLVGWAGTFTLFGNEGEAYLRGMETMIFSDLLELAAAVAAVLFVRRLSALQHVKAVEGPVARTPATPTASDAGTEERVTAS
ncbi:DUF4328 domain-containing protein [Streptomyces sp. NPDC097619]|uniref:DUF4328 domain-containing protein n=1 Tax=Streptomyces sp. NPDC097619 TaxID=3157228 RepID=UPI003320E814